MTIILYAAIYLIAVLGYRLFWVCRLGKDTSFFPVFFISFNVVALYPFGLFGQLKAGSVAVTAAGIALLLYCLIRYRKELRLSHFIDLPSVFVIACVIWSYVITGNAGVSHPDDMTHWYRICKVLAFEGGFPTSPDIRFQSYLPGTAIWVSQVTRVIGFSVSNCFFAQSIVDIACGAALMSIIPKEGSVKAKVSAVAAVICAVFMFRVFDISIYTLLVDTLLGLVPMAVAVYILSRREKIDRADIALITIGCVFTCLIKSSAILFVLCVAAILMLYLPKKKRYFAAIAVAVPVVFYLIYSFTMSYRYTDYGNSAQAVSIERYSGILGSKDSTLLLDIFLRFIFNFFSVLDFPQILLLWICIIFMVIMKIKKIEVKLVRILGIQIAVFSVGLLLTYFFSMQESEANANFLNSFERYMGTVVIFVFGILFYLGFKMLHASFFKHKIAVAGGVAAFLLIFSVIGFDVRSLFGHGDTIYVGQFDDSTWKVLDSVCDENTVYSEDKYVIIFEDQIYLNDYPWKNDYLVETFFRNEETVSFPYCYVNDEIYEGDRDKLLNCDYIIIVGEVTDQLDYLNELYPDTEFVSGVNCMK